MKKSKKNEISASNSRTDGTIEFTGLFSNISRAREICAVGGHTMSLVWGKDKPIHQKDIELIIEQLDLSDYMDVDGDLLVEVVKPSFDQIRMAMRLKYETLEDIEQRVKQAKEFAAPEVSSMDDASMSLLSVSYDRLELGLYEVDVIRNVAATIAQMDFSDKIKAQHIAEAIQYRAIDKDKEV